MINADNLQPHEAYCKKNIKKCPKCNLPVHKNELEDHLADHDNVPPQQEKEKEFIQPQPIKVEQPTKLLQSPQEKDLLQLANNFANSQQFYEITKNEINLDSAKIEGPTIKCSNCLRDVAEATFPLHEPSCLKNIIKCPKCQEPIDKQDMEYHEIEVHGEKPKIDPAVQGKNSLVPIIGISLVRKEMKSIDDIQYLMDPNVVTLMYFSAHWCPPCRNFTPLLIDVYDKMNRDSKKMEIIFISLDENVENYLEYLKVMPWISLPFTQKQRREKLTSTYRIRGIPTLYVINKLGKVLNPNAVEDTMRLRGNTEELYNKWKAEMR